MKMKKSLLAVLLSMLFMFSSFVPSITVYASNNVSISDDFMKYNQKVTGFIVDKTTKVINFYKDFFNLHKNDYNGDDKSFDDFINDNIYDDGTNTTYSPDVVNFFRDCTLNYINDETGFQYVYSYNGAQFLNSPKFDDSVHYHAFLDLLNASDNFYIAYCPYFDEFIVMQANDAYIKTGETTLERPDIRPVFNWLDTAVNTRVFHYDSENDVYSQYDTYSSSLFCTSRKSLNNNPNFNYQSYYLIDLNTTQYLVYNSLDSLKAGEEGVQEYYVTDSFNTSNVNAPITYSNESINNQISYQNVSNYVNSYYVNNQVYPSSQDTYNYINNYNGNGGGSGSGSDDDDDDDGWDWGFLDTIAGFFKGLLKALKTALEGILDLLTGVVNLFIGEEQPDGTRSGGIPTIIGKLVAHFLPMLPDWCTQLIGFSVLLSLILGIVKLIRGH